MKQPRINGRFGHSPMTPMERFCSKLAFDPRTGCVMWIGTLTVGQGHNEPYGYFWNGERNELAHRWAAANIHGFEITGLQVDHNCPFGPSTLCVEHVKPEKAEINRQLQHLRPGRAFQSLETKRYWVFVQKGLEQLPPRFRIENPAEIPFADPGDFELFEPPAWLRPYMEKESTP